MAKLINYEALLKLIEACKPFVEAADNLDDKTEDRNEIWELPAAMSITAGDLRTIRRLLIELGEKYSYDGAERLEAIRRKHPGTPGGEKGCDYCFLVEQITTSNVAVHEKDAEIERLKQALVTKGIEIQSLNAEISWRIKLMKGNTPMPLTSQGPVLGDDDKQITDRAWEISRQINNTYWVGRRIARAEFRQKISTDERAAIAAMARNCPEPIVNEMMEVRAKEVAGLHMADQIRRILLVFADAVERGDHTQITEQEDK